MEKPVRQRDHAMLLLKQKGIVRLSEFTRAGVTAATVSRLSENGEVHRLSRGLYQLPDAALDTHHALAELAKKVPKGVVCLASALAFHELTDAIPSRVWIAIGPKSRRPSIASPSVHFVRFGEKVLTNGIEEHAIEGVKVRVYNPAKTVVDLFRYRQQAGKRYKRSTGLNLALEGMREALRKRKATPAAIAKYAQEAGAWKLIEPYLEAMTANA
jgi:predicted transcriptional regulator of viral defense system